MSANISTKLFNKLITNSSDMSNSLNSMISTAACAAVNSFQSIIHTTSTAMSANSGSGAQIDGTDGDLSFKLDKKHFDKVNRLAEKLLKYCQSERMNLINSPPYIIDILPDICQAFNTILFVYENKLHVLNDIDYFCILIQNVLDKFQQLVNLFKVAGKRMYEETSESRQLLIKYTLIFSHILAEMKSIFPKDVYEGQMFRIAKKDAEEFWKANFGERIIINWSEFVFKLNRVHKISSPSESYSLKETIQLTKSKHVSIFEFDIFTRLFQPWSNLLNNWKFLVTEHPAYCAFSTYDEVHKRLQKHINKPGSYLFRLSCTKLGQWAIGYVTNDHKILQTIPQSLIQALIDGQKQNLYLYPDGRDINIDISSAIAVTSASRIQISKEQHDMYLDMGTLFQVCKICSENNKDRKLEPCGHLICSTCLENWQDLQTTPSCPFCRCEIKTFEPIIITPFEEKSNQKYNLNLNQTNETEDENLTSNLRKSLSKAQLSSESSSSSKISINSLTEAKVSPKDGATHNGKHSNLSDDQNEDTNEANNLNKNSKATNESKFAFSNSSNDQEAQSSKLSNCLESDSKIACKGLNNNSQNAQMSQQASTSALKKQDHGAPVLPPLPPPPTQIVDAKQPNSNELHFELNVLNRLLFNSVASNYDDDKIRVACALVLAKNDLKIANELLTLSKKK